MEKDLQQLMESGLSEKDLRSITCKQINELFKFNVGKEPKLSLVNDFAHKHHLEDEFFDEGGNLDIVRRFCGNHILSLNKPDKRVIYTKQRESFKADFHVLASIRDFNIEDPDQVWYLLMFCKKHVDDLTSKLPFKNPSVKEELETLVDEISAMNFNNEDWTQGYPEYNGYIDITVGGRDKHTIKSHYSLHLLSDLINQYLHRIHTEQELFIMDNHFDMEDKDQLRWKYLNGKECLTTEEEKELRYLDKTLLLRSDNSVLFEERDKYKKIALLKFFIIDYFNNEGTVKHSVDYYYENQCKGMDCLHNRLWLVAKLISYISNYGELWPINRVKLYNEESYLKDNLKGHDIRTISEAANFIKSISQKRQKKA